MTRISPIKNLAVPKDWESMKCLKAGAGWVCPTGKSWKEVSNWLRVFTHHFREGLVCYGFEKEDVCEKDYRFGSPSNSSDLKYLHASQPFFESLCGSAGVYVATPGILDKHILKS